MSEKTVKARIQQLSMTEAEWMDSNVILGVGEMATTSDTAVIKYGNGKDLWRDLKSHKGEQGDSIEYAKIDDDDLIVKIEGQSEKNLGNVRGPQGEQGDSIESIKIVGDELIVKIEGQPENNLGDVRGPQGEQGHSVEYAKIVDDELVVKIENEPEVNLGNVKGDKGEPFTYDDLTEEQILAIRGSEIDTSGFVKRTELNDQLDSKADVNHSHSISDVDGLESELAGKSDTEHVHEEYASKDHTHTTSDIEGLDSFAKADHTHDQYVTSDEVADLVPDVDLSNYYTKEEHDDSIEELVELYAPIDHTHEIDDVTNLQTSLNNKANASHTHNISDISNLQSNLNNKANTNHTHSISNITNLQSQLNSKASSSHTHDERYSRTGHTHSEYALKSEVPQIKQVTQSEYDRLSSKDSNTLYVVVE